MRAHTIYTSILKTENINNDSIYIRTTCTTFNTKFITPNWANETIPKFLVPFLNNKALK